jgi:hypothetical protein
MIAEELKRYIIVPTLKEIGMYSAVAVNLLLGTCAVETNMGKHIHQINGSALGIYQEEPATFWDLQQRFLIEGTPRFQFLFRNCCKLEITECCPEDMMWNFNLATIMARLKYWSIPEPLPPAHDIGAQARYWKQHYNTEAGKGTTEQFVIKGKKHKVY